MRLWRSTLAATVAATAIGLVPAVPAQAAPPDIAAQLAAIPGMTVSEQTAPAPGYRFFFLSYRQPVDHLNPNGATFQQRLQLLHRDVSRPMVLHTTGYNMPEYAFRSEPAQLVDGNQISVEQRFFEPSRPNPANWTKLDIWQAATDHHRIVQALKPIYTKKWISTGASKGGMTSVYHRRFYPRDVDGVVAYVAPNDAVNTDDSAYDDFFASVGSTPACEDALEAVQHEALARRTDMVNRYEALALANGWTFDQVFGTADKAFEMSVLDLAWTFWQYSLESACPTVPPVTASSDEIFDFINDVIGLDFYTDQGILPYEPYFYQAATQLGWPQPKFRYLRDVAHYPHLYVANSSLPPALRSKYDSWPMTDVDRWVAKSSSQMLFVYGSNDPWGAERFRPSNNDSFIYTAPGANHGANISRLTAPDAAAARATVLRWAGVAAVANQRSAGLAVLDSRNPDLERRPL
ncbi:S28 family serine protease [Actinophytocola sp.]|uniref:S28 family serine protease n=1 Tax=Actinophytocola sp. TaxID=1872138 RepID=UPI002D4049FE|nr:S28 family serine protease [Actinophytocola sp.]HYQ69282.1 S28 family serine protease [Actinophytocola sp.]